MFTVINAIGDVISVILEEAKWTVLASFVIILPDSSLEVSADFTSAFNVTLNENGLFVFALA